MLLLRAQTYTNSCAQTHTKNCVQQSKGVVNDAGIAGGAGPNHSLADTGTTVGEVYNVSQPVGQRWSTVADSQIWRLYHSVAFLTANAEVNPLPNLTHHHSVLLSSSGVTQISLRRAWTVCL